MARSPLSDRNPYDGRGLEGAWGTPCPYCGSDEVQDCEEILGVGWIRISEIELVTRGECLNCGRLVVMRSRYVDSGDFINEPAESSDWIDSMELYKEG